MERKFKQTEIGEIPEGWDVGKLSDITKKITKGTTPTTLGKNFSNCGINFIKVESISESGTFLTDKFCYIDEETNEMLKRSIIEEDDVLFSIAGAIGRTAHVTKDILPANTNQALAIIRPATEKVIPRFLKYYLSSGDIKEYAKSRTVQSVQANVSLSILADMPIIIPPVQEQVNILRILSSLDDKIELNRKMNKTLESIAQAIFKRWFIDFEFPNENSKPYKSSGGKIVDCDLGEIPIGWAVKEIANCGEIVCGKTPPTADSDNYGDDIFFITIPDMRGQAFIIKTERKLSKKGASTQHKKELPSLTVCVSCIATPGLVSLTSAPSHTNQQINSIVCDKNTSPFFMYYAMFYKGEEIKSMGLGGTATLNLNTGNFARIKIVVPESAIMDTFHKIVAPFMEKILSNLEENENLCDVRDSLLPRLMSGKIRVN